MAKRVAVLGGGVAGLTAAHELIERGFKVDIYEKYGFFGGKARSYPKLDTGVRPRRNLPAEHGFRFFPGFYRHLPDSMQRIPFGRQPHGVLDNLVEATRVQIARQGEPPFIMPARFPSSFDEFRLALHAFAQQGQLGIRPSESLYFAERMFALAASCDERRLQEYEHQSWWDFIGAAERSAGYQRFLATGMTRSLVACRANEVSARTGGTIALQLFFALGTPAVQVDRLLNGPSDEVWLSPWVAYLKRCGVRFHPYTAVAHIDCEAGHITGVAVRPYGGGRTSMVTADYYVAAMPVEVMTRLASDALCRAEPRLAHLRRLRVAWMNGVQFYLRRDVPIVHGHVIYIDSPWALTSVSQRQFWRQNIADTYGDGSVHGILSVDVSNWEAPGLRCDKPARDCSPDEIREEIWAQLKAHLNVGGTTVLRDTDAVDYQMDRDIRRHQLGTGPGPGDTSDLEPLLINTVGSWEHRPDAVTAIDNLFLAADYVRTSIDLATMEGANEAARRAVNGILDRSGFRGERCPVWPLTEPAIFQPLRALDRVLYQARTTHPYLAEAASLLEGGAAHLLALLGRTAPPVRASAPLLPYQPPPLPGRRALRIDKPADRKLKVAILGGGVGSIATAFQLTSTPELRDRYEVTVYQRGWRLGGKGASGRNRKHAERIEEHGLHLWFGFYDNAFHMMRQCYEELGRPAGAPLARLDDAFKPCDTFVLYEHHKERWRGWEFDLPSNSLPLGEPAEIAGFWNVAEMALGWLRHLWQTLGASVATGATPPSAAHRRPGSWLRALAAEIGVLIDDVEVAGHIMLLEVAHELARRHTSHPERFSPTQHRADLVRLLDELKQWSQTLVEQALENDAVRLFFTTADLIATATRGIVADGILEYGFDCINDEELTAWLRRHGAHRMTLAEGPFVRVMYDMAFGYRDGDVRRRDIAAGVALSAMLRICFTYKTGWAFKMQAGMGDAVFAPFYEVLRARGVKFEFFHCVTRLRLAANKKSIAAIEIVPQAAVIGGEYQPLFDVKGLPCWPSAPLWEQLEEGERLQRDGVNFEYEDNPLNRRPRLLRRGKDFDVVVLGISVAALPAICRELIDHRGNPDFKKMIDSAATTMTQAFQLWLNRPLGKLRWPFEANSIMTTYVEPMDTYANMSHLIGREDWAAGANLRSIAYFCGVLPDRRGDSQEATTARVKQNALRFLKTNVGPIWPGGVARTGGALDWQSLVDPSAQPGSKRFDAQYWCANFQPTERYVLSPAKAVRNRLRADRSGYENLVLTGDWIDSGFNVGCVEAAVIAGMQAARAIIGVRDPIVGEDARWLTAHRGGR